MCLRKISNKCSECLANVTNACECLRMGLQTLRMHLRMLRMSYQRCQCLAIFLRMLRIFDDAAAIGINSGKTFVRKGTRRKLQTPYKCLYERCQRLRTLYQRYQWLTNAYEWPSSQHSLKFRKRFLNWPIFVRRWRMTCERSEFVTNAYEDTANVAKFERLSNISIRKHIR